MDETLLVLANSIRRDQEAIATIYGELARHPLTDDAGPDRLIVIAYHLHNLYNTFESIFQNIAAVFENSVDDVGRWHAQLLERMCLDVMPLRPAVMDRTMYDGLDELRRFRHLFRHSYALELDRERLRLVLGKAMVLKEGYGAQLERFVTFLHELARVEDEALP